LEETGIDSMVMGENGNEKKSIPGHLYATVVCSINDCNEKE